MAAKILIVDDEKIEREGLKRLIRNHGLELEIAEAASGEAAIERLRSEPADILLTDIRMRKLDGLQLGKQARELHPDLKVVIFSAYGEFEYAKRAIDIKAVHYLLKPIEVDEFLQVMTGLIRQCGEERLKRERDAELANLYVEGRIYKKHKALAAMLLQTDSPVVREEALLQAGIDLAGKWIQPFLIDVETTFFLQRHDEFGRDIAASPPSINTELLPLNERQCLLLQLADKRPAEREQESFARSLVALFGERYGERAVIVIGRTLQRADDVAAEYARMEETLESKFFFFDRNMFYTWKTEGEKEEAAQIELDGVLARIDRLMVNRDIDMLKKEMKRLFEAVQGTGYSAIYTKYVAAQIVRTVARADDTMSAGFFRNVVEEVYSAGSIRQIVDSLSAFVHELCERQGQDDPRLSKRKAINDAVHYIHENYMHDIGLETVAGHVYLSPGYFSQLFKKETGRTLMKYITTYRLEKAKELLAGTNLKVKDIGAKVGYPNLSYFCLLFVNHYGVSPSGFRDDGDSL